MNRDGGDASGSLEEKSELVTVSNLCNARIWARDRLRNRKQVN